ncbi:hypothetical protein IAU60_004592 [Kwoniella sp. DSM 27419]
MQCMVDHFVKNPMPAGACALIDLPGDVFLDTEEEINLIAASLWILCVKYDNLPSSDRPTTREGLAKVGHFVKTMLMSSGSPSTSMKCLPSWAERLSPLSIQKDVGQMLHELVSKTLPAEKDSKDKAKK